MPKPVLASRWRRPSFDNVDHPWIKKFGHGNTGCDHCGSPIGRCVLDEDGNVWGLDCFARATGNPRIRRVEPEPRPSMAASNVRRWSCGVFLWRFSVPQLRAVPECNMGDWENVRVEYPNRAAIPAKLIESLDERSLRKYRLDCQVADKRGYPV